jgi:HK97 family phage major capsid protein
MMNKLTYAAFKQAQYGAGFPIDPFEGCPVVFNDHITALSAATTGVTWMIVGDLGYGALANFPNGEEIQIKRDDYTLAASDLVRFIGREYVGIGPVAPGAFVKVTH